MDLYDTRRANLLYLIRQLGVTQKELGVKVGYNGGYVGQLLNRQPRRKGGAEVLVTEKVVTRVLAHLKFKKLEWLTREWFDQNHVSDKLPPPTRRGKRAAFATVEPTPASRSDDQGGTTTMDPMSFLRLAQTIIPTFDTINQQLTRELVNAITSSSANKLK